MSWQSFWEGKDMEKILTVVVPMYNIEAYIRNCLDSFKACIGKTEFEVLIVDDGSSDHSPETAMEYVKENPGTFRLIRKENGGHGSTINTGLRESRGKYFKVVDGDDWVEKEAFLHLLEYLSEADSDIVASNYCWVHHETMEKKRDDSVYAGLFSGSCRSLESSQTESRRLQYGKEYEFGRISDRIFLKMHNLTYRTEVLREAGLQIDEHCFYVDLEFDLLPVHKIRTISFLEDSVYMYRIGMAGQSMSLVNMQKNRKQYAKVLHRLFTYYRECRDMREGCPRENLSYIENGIALAYTSYFKILLSFPASKRVRSHMEAYEKMVREWYPSVYKRVSNQAVCLLRKSRYRLYFAAQAALKLQSFLKRKKGLNL